MYSIKEIFYTLQGEGAQAGRAAIFLRFSGCNLWSGREKDRANAICNFCDTDFVGINGIMGGKYPDAKTLAGKIRNLWPGTSHPYVVCTGGEPLLQLDDALLDALHEAGCIVAIETNGTIKAPPDVDWICVSPKPKTEIVQQSGNELKFIYPQKDFEPEPFLEMQFDHFYLQPMDGPNLKDNTLQCVQYCMEHPEWKLSLQSHKILGIP